jgi:PLP dependent protein
LIKNNYENFRQELLLFCQKNKIALPPKLIAVSKKQSLENIEALYSCGHNLFAENYVQEFLMKYEKLSHLKDIRWHLIGPLQSNKVKSVLGKVDTIHSVASLSTLNKIHSLSLSMGVKQKYLIQIMLDETDTSKSGFSDISEVVEYFSPEKNPNIAKESYQYAVLCGFMGIAPQMLNTQQLEKLFQNFSRTCEVAWKNIPIAAKCQKMELSLGMSNDWGAATNGGSTMIRIGSKIFGLRT